MATIKPYTLKNNEIRYEVFVSNGRFMGTGNSLKIHKRGFVTLREAEKWAKIKEGEIASGSYLKENPNKLTIGIFLDEWIEKYKKRVKEGTRIVHRNNIKTYIKPFIGDYQLDKYTRKKHQDYIDSLFELDGRGRSGKGLSLTTVRSINATLSNAFKKAIQLGYVKENPTEFVEFPREDRESKNKLHYYTFEQSERFLEYAQKERQAAWYPFFLMIFDQGLRKGEVLGLQWQDIDFSKNEIHVVRERLTAAEKKENSDKIITDDTKTYSSKRTLPMTTRSKTALLTFRNHIIATFGTLPVTSDRETFIFVLDNPHLQHQGQVIRDKTVTQASYRIEKKAELPHITVHDGRHTFAVRCRQAGVPLEDIKDLLGHKDVATSQIYAQISPEVTQRSMQQFENYMQKKSTQK